MEFTWLAASGERLSVAGCRVAGSVRWRKPPFSSAPHAKKGRSLAALEIDGAGDWHAALPPKGADETICVILMETRIVINNYRRPGPGEGRERRRRLGLRLRVGSVSLLYRNGSCFMASPHVHRPSYRLHRVAFGPRAVSARDGASNPLGDAKANNKAPAKGGALLFVPPALSR
jgi:hypothetical protein